MSLSGFAAESPLLHDEQRLQDKFPADREYCAGQSGGCARHAVLFGL
jgi:hypothetical protein